MSMTLAGLVGGRFLGYNGKKDSRVSTLESWLESRSYI